ncbi:MAG: hypothetical protein HY820_39870 [Acidobacteria bacterium]|nr:hypothetical protein [Acidobacteriota bacterium]
MLKLRTRRFSGRCSRHKRFNPATDGRGGIKGGCARCQLLADIWETSIRLNGLIRKFDPGHDDASPLKAKAAAVGADPRQLSLLEAL